MKKDLLETIGNTPMVELSRLSPGPGVRVFAKLESYNPTGSLKDRIIKYMLARAEESGELTPDRIILEPTSGNTGISLAMIGLRKGYRVKVVLPENVSPEIRQMLELYKAEVAFSAGDKGTNGAIELARSLVAQNGQYYMPFQYGNEANPLAHYETTGAEILRDLPRVDVFVAGLGTGGTLMGVGRRLKEKNPRTRVIAVVPHPGDHIHGLRSLEEGFIPPILDLSLLDGRVLVDLREALQASRDLLFREGIFAGISSGAVAHVALKLARGMKRGNIVALFADSGWKYLSSGLWTRSFPEVERELATKFYW